MSAVTCLPAQLVPAERNVKAAAPTNSVHLSVLCALPMFSGNPEEGELRPQLLDRFGMHAQVRLSEMLSATRGTALSWG